MPGRKILPMGREEPTRHPMDRPPLPRGRELFEPKSRTLSAPVHPGAVFVKSAGFTPFIYRKRVDRIQGNPEPGDVVAIKLPDGTTIGHGLFNPQAELVVRLLSDGPQPPGESFWKQKLERAVSLRRDWLKLDDPAGACRLIHAEGDGLSGLAIDRFASVLSIEAFSLGMYERARAIAELLGPMVGTKHWVIQGGPRSDVLEGFAGETIIQSGTPRTVEIREEGTRFRVPFIGGHKTGYFCDQRENRLKLARFCENRRVLDVCCYTGGFAIQAKRLGKGAEVTGVDLDEGPLELARENANLNQLRVNWVQADAFTYMRDLVRAGKRFDVVVLDPPKLITSRADYEEGKIKHFDLNRLALQLVEPGGLMLTCSCAGLLQEEDFVHLVLSAARRTGPPSGMPDAPDGRRIQIIDRSGASSDHPIADHCPENAYLKGVWLRVW